MPSEITPVELLDQLASKLAKRRRLAHITRADLAFEAGVDLEVIERIETGRPVAHDDLTAVLDVVAAGRRPAQLQVPAPRGEASADQLTPPVRSIATA